MSSNLQINTDTLVYWFNALRNVPPEFRGRALDAFWSGQIESKCWLVNTLNNLNLGGGHCYIFGGWLGLLGNMLLNCSTWRIGKVRSIDMDPWCEKIADEVNQPHLENDWRFKAVTSDMKEYIYDWGLAPSVVINTSTEHVNQDTYDQWWDKIPPKCLIVLQGNDYFSCGEHVRCSTDLHDFKRMNHAHKTLFEGVLPTSMYNRFMVIYEK